MDFITKDNFKRCPYYCTAVFCDCKDDECKSMKAQEEQIKQTNGNNSKKCQMLESLILDIDMKLGLIEDYAKGEVGKEITKLRGYLYKQLKKI